jgi:phage gpG-like protein
MSVVPDSDRLAEALSVKADMLRAALVAKVDANLAGGVLQIRSGALRESIRSALQRSSGGVDVSLESDGVPYAAIQEYGGHTAAHEIVATKARALVFAGAGGTAFAKSVHHPGSAIPARSYLGSALAAMRDDIVEELRAAVFESLSL